MMHRIRSLSLAAAIAALPGVLHAAVVIDDHFNDGNITTNTLGVGNGFTGATTDPGTDPIVSKFIESGTQQTILAMIPAGANIMGIASNDTFNFFNSGGATITWDVHHYAQVSGSFRLFLGVGDTQNFIAGTVGTPFLTDEAYVWVQIRTADDSLGAGMQGALLVDKAGEDPLEPADVLAMWEWNAVDGISPLTITMNLDQDGYDLSFSDGTAAVTGGWNGYFTAADWSAGARAIASAQSATTGRMVLDRVQVSTVDAVAGDADFNNDNIVDGADFLIWQRGLGLGGQTDNSNGDADESTVVDGADLEVWKAHLGQPSGLPAIAAVPEPASLALLLTAVGGVAIARSRTHRKPFRVTSRGPAMSKSSIRLFSLVAVLMVTSISSARAVVVIDDPFNDGDLATNTTGVGTGFDLAFTGAGSTTVNSGTLQALVPVGANIMGIASKETFNFFNPTGATVVWDVHHYVAPQPPNLNSFRAYVGVGDGPGNLDTTKASPFLTGEAYVWIQLAINDVMPIPTGAGNQGALIVDKPGGGDADVLVAWNWATFDGLSPMRITMNLTDAGYDISFTDGTPNVTGSWNSYFTPSHWAAGARAIASVQSNDFGRGVFDRVQVNTNAPTAAVPEPASWLLLGAALLSLGAARRRAGFTADQTTTPSRPSRLS